MNGSSSITRNFLAAALIAAPCATAGAQCVLPERRIDDRAIIDVRAESTLDAFRAAFAAAHPDVGLVERDSVPGRSMYLLELELPPGYDDVFMAMLEADLEANYTEYLYSAELLYETGAAEGKTGSTFVDGLSQNDFQDQYARTLTGVSTAHARSTGAQTVVAVLDTGADATHPLLTDRLLPFGFDFVDGDTDPQDAGDGAMVGHGTFVAGLLALTAPDTRILAVRVLNGHGIGDGWMLTRGLYYAIDRGVEVINLSLGSTDYDVTTVKQAIAEAARRGIVVVAAAGNFNCEEVRDHPAMADIDLTDPIDPPIEITGAFGVAATDHEDIKWDDSNYHRKLVISAPGATADGQFDPATAIVSSVPGAMYASWEGTSFATPLVSGTIALIRSQHPEWDADLGTYLVIESILRATAQDIYDLNPLYAKDESLGAGRLDAGGAVGIGPVAPGPGDFDGNGRVDLADLLVVLNDWGRTHSSADLDGDGTVGIADLVALLAHWS